MSSTYRVLCLSHDPSVVAADGDWSRPEHAEAAIRDGIEGHEDCDLLIGRYSYPLVEVGCPATPPAPRVSQHRCGYHPHHTAWVDVTWLWLLALAQQQPDGTPLARAAARARACWAPERLYRLRNELDFEGRA